MRVKRRLRIAGPGRTVTRVFAWLRHGKWWLTGGTDTRTVWVRLPTRPVDDQRGAANDGEEGTAT